MDSRTEQAKAAEKLLFEELDHLEEGRSLDLEALCAARPRLAGHLRRAYRDWRWVVKLGEKTRGDPPLSEDQLAPAPELGEPRSGSEDRRYTLLEEIATGGMGKIYRTWDSHVKRTLAMKVSAARHSVSRLPGAAAASRAVYRFLEEAEIMGQLDHPGVVPVHDLGMDTEGRVYFTMDLVQGLDLEQVFEKVHAGSQDWNQTRVVGVLVRVCETLSYAHQKGVIHRDIKPANVMVGRFGQTYVMDWGLARVVPEDDVLPDWDIETKLFVSERQAQGQREPGLDLLTRTGSIVGTPAYMPPEQARAFPRQVGRHSDIYAVGAMLYHLLAGRAPYADVTQSASDSQEVIEALKRSPATPLARLAADAAGELVAICEKAMARRISDRYGSMTELADDLRAFLEDRVVRAHRTGALVELSKWRRRNPVAASAVALAVLLLVGSAGTLAWMQARLAQKTALEREHADEVLRLSAGQDLSELVREADALWPAVPDRLLEIERWIERAAALALQVAGLRAQRDALPAENDSRSPGEESRLFLRLSHLIQELERLGDDSTGLRSAQGVSPEHGWSVPRRRDLALRLAEGQRPGGVFARRWAEVRDPLRDAYPDLRLAPQEGLVPLGPDPVSGLWEFWHVPSGSEPTRGPDGAWQLDASSGLVLVLLPGGRFRMGAQAQDPQGWNHDARAERDEAPVHAVDLSPFFLSKYEMTQGQWARLNGSTPSAYPSPDDPGHATASLHPVERVSWASARRTLLRVGLELPSEAQWEYASRAGTTPWWTGEEPVTLQEPAAAGHSPVGSGAPNPFGLHDVMGNLREWCLDAYHASFYDGAPEADPVNLDYVRDARVHRVTRGGSYADTLREARAATRTNAAPGLEDERVGLRPARPLDR